MILMPFEMVAAERCHSNTNEGVIRVQRVGALRGDDLRLKWIWLYDNKEKEYKGTSVGRMWRVEDRAIKPSDQTKPDIVQSDPKLDRSSHLRVKGVFFGLPGPKSRRV